MTTVSKAVGGAGRLDAPFPWFGGKSRAAGLIWSRLGLDIRNYVEPFFGSGAVWLGRPEGLTCQAVVNDLDAHLANVWRAMRRDPAAVAEHACWPVNEADLHARHLRLVQSAPRLRDRLCGDADYVDAELAGWWIWGCSAWIGSGWCGGQGGWVEGLDDEGVRVLVKAADDVDGGAGRGVTRQLPHLTGSGRGILRAANGVDRLEWLRGWFADLSERMREVRVTCGDWSRICSVGTMTSAGACGVVLDPPYSQTAAVYAHDSNTVSGEVRQWCVENGGNRMLRIALCGHAGEHESLESHGWRVERWAKRGGYQGADDRERIWFSPHCVNPADDLFGGWLGSEVFAGGGNNGKKSS